MPRRVYSAATNIPPDRSQFKGRRESLGLKLFFFSLVLLSPRARDFRSLARWLHIYVQRAS